MARRRRVALLIGILSSVVVGLLTVPPAGAAGLSSGQTLRVNESVTSAGGGYRLTMQDDGNLVLYGPGGPRWQAGTAGSRADRAVLQQDGNLVVYRSSIPVWSSGTSGIAATGKLEVQDDGNLVIYAGNGAVWSSASGRTGGAGYAQPAGVPLTTTQYLASSNGSYRVVMQGDGNFVGYAGAPAFWASNTRGAGGRALVQGDGNLVVYPGGGSAWGAGTANRGPMSGMVLQNDGNLVLNTVGNGAAWSARTGLTGRSGNWLSGNQALNTGAFLSSPNGAYRAAMQPDGNFVVYGPTGAIWQSGSRGAGARAVFQPDGNLVVYSGSRALWNPGVSGFGGNKVALQDDGNLVIYAGTRPLWSSKTGVMRNLQPMNLLIPAGTCGIGSIPEPWNQERPIQLVNGVGESFDADENGAGILATEHLGNVDVNGDGINEIVVMIACTGTPYAHCCAGRASIMNYVAVLNVSGAVPTRVGNTIEPGTYSSEPYQIYDARLSGTSVVTTQGAIYRDGWPTRQVTYRYVGGRWVS